MERSVQGAVEETANVARVTVTCKKNCSELYAMYTPLNTCIYIHRVEGA